MIISLRYLNGHTIDTHHVTSSMGYFIIGKKVSSPFLKIKPKIGNFETYDFRRETARLYTT